MKNIETPDKKHLDAIIHDLSEGKYAIPDFQRDFEWNPWDVNELLKSIFENYYIGTLLLWRASKENIDYLSCQPIYGFNKEARIEHIVLDGQQRLSALYYAFFAPDKPFPNRKSKYYYFIKIDQMLAGNYDQAFIYQYESNSIKKLLSNEESQFEQKLFPLKFFGDRGHIWLKWLEKYEKYWQNKLFSDATSEREKIEEIFSSIKNEYYISYIELDREIEVEKVCDIFTRINSTGLDLSIFDLMNALLRPKEIHLKKLWQENSNKFELPDPDKGKIYVLQTMSILKQTYCAPKFLYYLIPGASKPIKLENGKLDKTILIQDQDEFFGLWSQSVEKMLNSLKIISNHSDLGAINPNLIPYPSMLPIFTALNVEKENPVYQDRKTIEEKIRTWYWSSIFTKNYSSAVESQIAKDFIEMKTWFLDDDKVPSVIQDARRIVSNLDLESEENQNSSIYKAIFCILVKKGAKDFITYELPTYTVLEDHHIVPKSWGIKNNVKYINSILNRTPISDVTNKKIMCDNLPNIYLRRMLKNSKNQKDVYELLRTHLISEKAVEFLLKKDFGPEDFKKFLEERKKLIMREIINLVGII